MSVPPSTGAPVRFRPSRRRRRDRRCRRGTSLAAVAAWGRRAKLHDVATPCRGRRHRRHLGRRRHRRRYPRRNRRCRRCRRWRRRRRSPQRARRCRRCSGTCSPGRLRPRRGRRRSANHPNRWRRKIAKVPAVAKVSTPRDAPSAADSQPGVSGTHSASVFASFTSAVVGAGLSGGTVSRTPSPTIAVPVTPAAKYWHTDMADAVLRCLDTIWTPSVEACLGKAGLVYVLIAKGRLQTYGFAERLVNHFAGCFAAYFFADDKFSLTMNSRLADAAEVEPGSPPDATNDPPNDGSLGTCRQAWWSREHAARYGGIANAACRFTSSEVVTTSCRQSAVAPDAKRG